MMLEKWFVECVMPFQNTFDLSIWPIFIKKEGGDKKKASEFESKYGMLQAFDCVDGKHIPIVSNRKWARLFLL